MKLLLIRHGETVDNVAGLYAGVTDSPLTNHGVQQANRLGMHLAATVKISHIFSSDLTRASKTAEAIRLAQLKSEQNEATFAHETKQLIVLREQDFGYLERKPFSERSRDSKKTGKKSDTQTCANGADFKDVESPESMKVRADAFIDEHLLDLLRSVSEDYAVVVVAHGIILTHLWRCILHRFPTTAVSTAPGVATTDRDLTLEHLGGWSNTGYLELKIQSWNGESPEMISPTAVETPAAASPAELKSITSKNTGPKLLDMSLLIKAVNSLEHLKGLKKTRGGIGSSKHDEGQKTLESFFKKRKIG